MARKKEGESSKRNKLSPIAGIFAIIAACMCALIGGISLHNTIQPIPYTPVPGQPPPPWVPYPIWAVLGLLGFLPGIAGGILTLQRKMFNQAMARIALMLPEGVALPLGLFYLALTGEHPSTGAWVITTPVILLAVLSLFFATMSRKEFTS